MPSLCRRLILALLLALTLLAPALAQESAVARADAAYARGDYDTALSEYQHVVKDYPGHPIAWLRLARIYVMREEWESAVNAFETLTSLGPLERAVRIEYGDALRQVGRMDAALEQYSLAREEPDDGAGPAPAAPKPAKVKQEGAKPAPAQAQQPKPAKAKPQAAKTAPAKQQAAKAAKPAAQPPASKAAPKAQPKDPPVVKAQEVLQPVDAIRPPKSANRQKDPAKPSSRAKEVQPGEATDAINTMRATPATFSLRRGEQRVGAAADEEQAPSAEGTQAPSADDASTDWLQVARDHAAKGEWEEAVAAYEKLIAQQEIDIPVRLEYAEALRQAKVYLKAEREFNRVLHLDPENVDAKIGLAKTLAQQERLEEAMYLLDQIYLDSESYVKAQLARAFCYYVNGYPKETANLLGEVLHVEPDNPEALAMLEQLKNDERAQYALTAGQMPEDAAGQAEWYFQQGDYAKAKRQFEALLRSDRTNAQAWLRVATLCGWDGEWEEALDAYTNYLRLVPGDYTARLSYARALLASGEAEPARDESFSLISDSLVPLEIYNQALGVYAMALNATGERREALQWFDQALMFDMHNLELRCAYALSLAGLRRFEEALRQYDMVLREDPSYDAAKLGIAQVYAWKGEHKLALKLYSQIGIGSQYYGSSLIGQSYTYLWMGRRSDAVRLALDASRAKPDHPDLEALYARLGEKPDPLLVASWRNGHDNEDNDYQGLTTTLSVPLRADGTRLDVVREDLRLDNHKQNLETEGSNTKLALTVPLGDRSQLKADISRLSLRNSTDSNYALWTGGAEYKVDVTDDLAVNAGYRSLVFYDTPQLARNNIRVREANVGANFRIFDDKTRMYANYARGRLSDGNRRNYYSFYLQRPLRETPSGRLCGSLGYRTLHYAQDLNNGYWDPQDYRIGEAYLEWLDTTDHVLRFDGNVGWGLSKTDNLSSQGVWRYALGVRWYLDGDGGPVVRAGYNSSDAATTATTAQGYRSRWWYLTLEWPM